MATFDFMMPEPPVVKKAKRGGKKMVPAKDPEMTMAKRQKLDVVIFDAADW